MAKRETAADKLKKRLEEVANAPDVVEDGLADTPLLDDGEVTEKEVGLIHVEDEYTVIEDNDVDLSDDSLEGNLLDSENVDVDPSDTLDIPDEDPVVKEPDVFDKHDRLKVEMALAGAMQNPRVTAWSPIPRMILNYFKATRPASDKSISSEINDILSEGLIERYPDLYEAFQVVINESDDLHITNFKGIRRTRPDKMDSVVIEAAPAIE